MLETLWIMRHGLAEAQFESDFTRPLSKVGLLQVENVIQQLLSDSPKLPTQLLVSPLKRTQQTAAVVHKALGFSQPFETEEMLVHSAEHQVLGDFLLASSFRDLLLVSHMPIVAKLCQYLSPNCDILGFQTAQLITMDFKQDATGRLVGQVKKVYVPLM